MVDTAVLIDDLRDQAEAVTFLEGCGQPLAFSVVSGGASTVAARAQVWPRCWCLTPSPDATQPPGSVQAARPLLPNASS